MLSLSYFPLRIIFQHSNLNIQSKMLRLKKLLTKNIIYYFKPSISIIIDNPEAIKAVIKNHIDNDYSTILFSELFRLKKYNTLIEFDFKMDHYIASHIMDIDDEIIISMIYKKISSKNQILQNFQKVNKNIDKKVNKKFVQKLLLKYLQKYSPTSSQDKLDDDDIINSLYDSHLYDLIYFRNDLKFSTLIKIIYASCEINNIELFNTSYQKLSLNLRNEIFDTCLHIACNNNSNEIIKKLIRPDINIIFFDICCKNNNIEIVQLMIQYVDKNKTLNNNFIMSCSNGLTDLVQMFTNLQLSLNYEYGFLDACHYDHLNIVKILKSYVNPMVIEIGFYTACGQNNINISDYLEQFVSKETRFYGILMIFNLSFNI